MLDNRGWSLIELSMSIVLISIIIVGSLNGPLELTKLFSDMSYNSDLYSDTFKIRRAIKDDLERVGNQDQVIVTSKSLIIEGVSRYEIRDGATDSGLYRMDEETGETFKVVGTKSLYFEDEGNLFVVRKEEEKTRDGIHMSFSKKFSSFQK